MELTAGTWGDVSARRLGGCEGQEGMDGTRGGSTYPALVDARLADMSLDISKLVSANEGWNGWSRGMGQAKVMLLVVMLFSYGYARRSRRRP